MYAERFGSYSICGDLGRHAVLAALEVDPAVEALGAAAAMARRSCGRRSYGRPTSSGPRRAYFSGLAAGDLREVRIRDETTAGARRLRLANGTTYLEPPPGPGRSGSCLPVANLDDGLLPRAGATRRCTRGASAWLLTGDRADFRARSRRRAPRRPGGSASCARPGGRGRCTCRSRRARSSSRETTGRMMTWLASMTTPPPPARRPWRAR